jgi:RNA polymerase sigma-70 factor (ECF subfamily)
MDSWLWARVVETPPAPVWIAALAVLAAGAPPSAPAPDDDAELVRRLRARDADALAALYDRHAASVYAVCLRMLGDADAQEILSDVFWQLWESPERYDPARGTPAAFLTVLARSRAVDRLRATGRRSRILDGGEADVRELLHGGDEADPFAATADVELRRHVAGALSALDARQRRAIELSFYGALSHSEIAAALDAPLGTVKSWIRQGLARLRDALAERYGAGARA